MVDILYLIHIRECSDLARPNGLATMLLLLNQYRTLYYYRVL